MISKPVIRGLGYNRVITLVNGIKQEGQQWGDEHGIEIDDFSVKKVEISKEISTRLYFILLSDLSERHHRKEDCLFAYMYRMQYRHLFQQ